MKMKYPRIFLQISAVALIMLFFFPIWKITLVAPQYPDGISMYIWINKITGNEPGTLQNINILNHYVGMKMIEPDSIPELSYFQYIILFFSVTALILSFTKKKYLYLAWSVVLFITAVLGIYDFYLWEYDYGHHLSPEAPIKVPGMAYQPPLFGKKILLNFIAYSYPSWGSLFFALSLLCGFLAFFLMHKKMKNLTALSLLLLLLAGCSKGPVPIQFGHDLCCECQMKIMDQRYGSEVVTAKGKVYKFDAVECLLDYLKKNGSGHSLSQVLIIPFDKPGHLTAADSIFILRSKNLPSPMGMGLTAFTDRETAGEFRITHGGEILSWKNLIKNHGISGQ